MTFLHTLALAAALAAPGASEAPPRMSVISTGKQVVLKDHLRREGTTAFVFLNATSSMEEAFLTDLEKQLPQNEHLALRVIRLKNLDAPAAKQYEITATPTVIVLDRFGHTLARASDPAEIAKAVGQGLRM